MMDYYKNFDIEVYSFHREQLSATNFLKKGPRKVNLFKDNRKHSMIHLYEDGIPQSFLVFNNNLEKQSLPKAYYAFDRLGRVKTAIHFDKNGFEELIFKKNQNEIFTEYLSSNTIKTQQNFENNLEMLNILADKININHPPLNKRAASYPYRNVS